MRKLLVVLGAIIAVHFTARPTRAQAHCCGAISSTYFVCGNGDGDCDESYEINTCTPNNYADAKGGDPQEFVCSAGDCDQPFWEYPSTGCNLSESGVARSSQPPLLVRYAWVRNCRGEYVAGTLVVYRRVVTRRHA